MRVQEGGGCGLQVIQDLPRGEEGGGGPVLEEGACEQLGPGLHQVGGGVAGGEVRMGEDLSEEPSASIKLKGEEGEEGRRGRRRRRAGGREEE